MRHAGFARPFRFLRRLWALQAVKKPSFDQGLPGDPSDGGFVVEFLQEIPWKIEVDSLRFQARTSDAFLVDVCQVKDVFALVKSAIKLLCGFSFCHTFSSPLSSPFARRSGGSSPREACKLRSKFLVECPIALQSWRAAVHLET